jgi:hypothetical protein
LGQTTSINSDALTESEKLATQRVEVSSAPKIIIEDRVGSITLTAGSDGVVVVDAEKLADSREALAGIQVEVSKRNDGVHIRWEPSTRTIVNRLVHFTIQAPRSSALELHISQGPIAIAGFERGAEAWANFGSIEVNSVKGDLRLHTSNGAVTVTEANGTVVADSTSGAITVKGSKGRRLSARTQHGRIEVRRAKGDLTLRTGGNGAIEANDIDGSLIAETVFGSIHVAGRLTGRNWLESGNGAITVTLPADSRLTVDASTGHGGIDTEFGLPVKGQVSRSIEGDLGDGAAGVLEIHTDFGEIELLKREK